MKEVYKEIYKNDYLQVLYCNKSNSTKLFWYSGLLSVDEQKTMQKVLGY